MIERTPERKLTSDSEGFETSVCGAYAAEQIAQEEARMNRDVEIHKVYPIRLYPSLRRQAAEIAHDEGVSLNYFVTKALSERMERLVASKREPSITFPTPEN